jgi:hypothetical protein
MPIGADFIAPLLFVGVVGVFFPGVCSSPKTVVVLVACCCCPDGDVNPGGVDAVLFCCCCCFPVSKREKEKSDV